MKCIQHCVLFSRNAAVLVTDDGFGPSTRRLSVPSISVQVGDAISTPLPSDRGLVVHSLLGWMRAGHEALSQWFIIRAFWRIAGNNRNGGMCSFVHLI